ncbi:MAG: hypothetical protein AVDCRST_MAG18-1779, partial [uncultured Thermomicrobiales bacterium]
GHAAGVGDARRLGAGQAAYGQAPRV